MNLTEARDTIVKEIIIKGSAERIFEALTNPDQRIKWWGAEGRFQTTEMESDLRPGGRWAMRGTGLGGKPFSVVGEYRALRSGRKGRCHDSPLDAFRPDERGRTRTSGLATDSDVAAGIRGGPPPGSRECITLKGTRPEDRRKTSYPSPADLRSAAQRGSPIRLN
jgi:Activator of Hsp90 ATPase homolog 1-like protein